MSAYLITHQYRDIHVGLWVINDSKLHTGRLRSLCGRGDMNTQWWAATDAEIATRRMCSRCVAVVKQMTTLIEQGQAGR